MARYKKITFVSTRYSDPELLRELGLFEEVEEIFDNMGLKTFVNLACDTYEDLTKEFFATLTAKTDLNERNFDDEVCIHFKIGGKPYSMDSFEMKRVYGFPQIGEYRQPRVSQHAPVEAWNVIGTGDFKGSVTKATNIRHPAIRYAHKVLAHTFFGRRETGYIAKDDFNYLLVGIAPFLGHLNYGEGIYAKGTNVSLSSAFVAYLLHIQDWIHTSPDKTPQIHIGGLLTPIFIRKGIELRGKMLPFTRVDKYYLTRTGFFAGKLGNLYAYRFQYASAQQAKILLPNAELTSLRVAENVSFTPGEEYWYNKATHGALTTVRATKNHEPSNEDASPSQEPIGLPPPPSGLPRGSARYDFQPWDDPIQGTALRKAHEHIHLLQRFIKWQGRSLRKVVNQVKHLSGEVKRLNDKISGAGCSNTQRDDVVDPNMDPTDEVEEQQVGDEAENMEEDNQERHSIHGTPTTNIDTQAPPRASAYERRKRRKRRATRSPTPPAPCSSNESYSVDSSTWN